MIANIITEKEFQDKIEGVRERIGKELYNQDGIDNLIVFLKSNTSILKRIKKSEVLNKHTLLKKCVSKTCLTVLCEGYEVWGNGFSPNRETIKAIDLARLSLDDLPKFFGIIPAHIRQIKEIVKGMGLEFKK